MPPALALVATVAVLLTAGCDRMSVHSDVDIPEEDAPAVSPHPGNHPPEIRSLTAATDRVRPWDICEITCDAFDPDGDPLTYTWSAGAGDIFGEGSQVELGSPVSEGLYRISVVVEDGRGGRAEESMMLRVHANSAPQITTIGSDVDWLQAGESVRLWCEAVDADGDAISYEWSASAGELFGEGASVIWLAPDESDSYWITVTARDAYGGEDRRALSISVTPAEPPSIVAMLVEPKETSLFRAHGDSWTIFKGGTCTIECVVADGDGPFTYEWSVDFGELEADGPVAVWQAPSNRVGATITVVVTDARGNKSSARALIYVETSTCPSCG